jgi:hypothetical protein
MKMKKLISGILFSVLYVSSVSAEIGINAGASAQMGLFSASGTEFSGTTKKDTQSEHGAVAWGSVFVEGVINDKFILGVDYVPAALETDTVETAKSDMGVAAATQTTVTNKVQIDFEHLTTFYAGLMLNENLYVKAGLSTVDVITNENLSTGAVYGDTELDGSMFGIGYHNALDNGVFFRVEGNYHNFDSASVTSTGTASDSKITMSSLDGLSGKLSIGKSF